MNVNTQWFPASPSPRTSLRGAQFARIGVGHAFIDNCSSEQVCASIIAHAQNRGRPAYVITPNAQHIVLLEKDRRLQEVYAHADLVIPDGISLLIAARFTAVRFNSALRASIFSKCCVVARRKQICMFPAGGRPGSAELAAGLEGHYPPLRCTTYCPPFGFEQDAAALKQTADAINAAQPDILFVAFGAPKQEYWIYEHGLQLRCRYVSASVAPSRSSAESFRARRSGPRILGVSGSIVCAGSHAGCGAGT